VPITPDMRARNIIVALTLGLYACSQPDDSRKDNESIDSATDSLVLSPGRNNPTSQTDTIEIWDDFASDPFLFNSWGVALDTVLKSLPPDVKIEKEVSVSKYYDNSTDTTTSISLGTSLIKHVKTPSIGHIDCAIISNKEIRLKKDIRIGDEYSTIIQRFPSIVDKEKTYRKIYINSGEATSTVIMTFDNDVLTKIQFWSYSG
jgi:hypothetical protein